MKIPTLISNWLLAAAATAVTAGSIYEVPEAPTQVLGAWDVNIMADDVHFATASVLRQIRLRLAIQGNQACQLWIFDALNSPPVYTAPFTNRPASNYLDVSTYDFDLHLQVPRDIYVGFSAQGDGWNAPTNTDYWTRGYSVYRGLPGSAGEYYFGSVAGGQLTTKFKAGDASYACLQILSEPVHLGSVGLQTGQVNLVISNLPVYATNALEQGSPANPSAWAEVELLPLGVESTTWLSTNPAAPAAFYRVKTR